jgi:hypothetical protein
MNNTYGIESTGFNQRPDAAQQAASDALLAQANSLRPTKRVTLQASLTELQVDPQLAQSGLFGKDMSAQWQVLQDQRTGQKYIDCGGKPQALAYNPQDNTYSFDYYEQSRIGNVHKSFRMRPTGANSFVGYEDIDQVGANGQVVGHVRYSLNGYSQPYFEQNAYSAYPVGINQISRFPINLPNQPQYAHQLRQLMKMPYNQFESHVQYPRAMGTVCFDPQQQSRYMGYQFARPHTYNVQGAQGVQGYEVQQAPYAQQQAPYAQIMPQYMGYQNGMPRDYQGNYPDYQGYEMAKPRGFFGKLKDYVGYKLGIGRPTTYYPQLGHYMGYVNGRPRNYVPMRGPAHPPGYDARNVQQPQEVMTT